jgi:hypothetical protein
MQCFWWMSAQRGKKVGTLTSALEKGMADRSRGILKHRLGEGTPDEEGAKRNYGLPAESEPTKAHNMTKVASVSEQISSA